MVPIRFGAQTAIAVWSLLVVAVAPPALADWPRFRGPNGSGVAADDAPTPTEFGEQKNLRWKVELPGEGVSCPIVVGDKVLVTTYSGYGAAGGTQVDLVRHLLCLDAETGRELWKKEIEAVLPEDAYSGMGIPSHGYASHTPVSDGERVFAFFGKSGVKAFDLEGNELWERSVGTDSDPRRWGSSSSPVVVDGVVVIVAGPEKRAIVGLDAKSGSELWTADSESLGNVWGTPVTAPGDGGKTDVVLGTPGEIWGINPATGKIRWYAGAVGEDGFNTSVVVADGVVYAVEGRSGGSIAVRTGGKGDVGQSHLVWNGRDANRFGTPLVYRGRVWFVSNRIANCLDAKTGEKIFQSRLPSEGGGAFGRGADYSSPVAADGKIYYVTGNGEVHVLKAADALESLAVNSLAAEGESFAATPAISDGAIYIRSSRHLWCFSEEGR
ncbi:MAG: serine/threonine protein kinase [Planctomycetota bacterium]|nr:MAG: serine/threonine protein kinase [Planctomycetota bacterium]